MSPFTPPPAPVIDMPALPADAVEVGRILGAWGIKGGIKVLYDLQYPASIVDATRRILSVI